MQSKFLAPSVLVSAVISHSLAVRHEDQELFLKFSVAVLTALLSMSTPNICAEPEVR